MEKLFKTYRKRYIIFWFIILPLIFLIIALQTIGRKYYPNTFNAWLWFIVNFIPVTIILSYSTSAKFNNLRGHKTLYFSTSGLFVLFFIVTSASIFLQPYMQKIEPPILPVELLMYSLYFLVPIQLIIIILLIIQVTKVNPKKIDRVDSIESLDENIIPVSISQGGKENIKTIQHDLSLQRLEALKKRLQNNQTLLAEWEEKLNLSDNPTEKLRCKNEIEKLKEAINEDLKELQEIGNKS